MRLHDIVAIISVIKRFRFPLEIMLVCDRWYFACPLSRRHLEEMMQERSLFVDHSTVHRWAMKLLPVLKAAFRQRKRRVGTSWRLDDTYLALMANGNICIALLIKQAIPSTSY